MAVLTHLIRLAYHYQDTIPVIVLVGSLLFDDFSDLRQAEGKNEFLQYLAERLISYLVVLFVLLVVVGFLFNQLIALDLIIDGYGTLI